MRWRCPINVTRCEPGLEAAARSVEDLMDERTVLVMALSTYAEFARRAPALISVAHLAFLESMFARRGGEDSAVEAEASATLLGAG